MIPFLLLVFLLMFGLGLFCRHGRLWEFVRVLCSLQQRVKTQKSGKYVKNREVTSAMNPCRFVPSFRLNSRLHELTQSPFVGTIVVFHSVDHETLSAGQCAVPSLINSPCHSLPWDLEGWKLSSQPILSCLQEQSSIPGSQVQTQVQLDQAFSEYGQSEFDVNSKSRDHHRQISRVLICLLNSKLAQFKGFSFFLFELNGRWLHSELEAVPGQLRCEVHPLASCSRHLLASAIFPEGGGSCSPSVTEVLWHPNHLPYMQTIDGLSSPSVTWGVVTSLNHKMAALPKPQVLRPWMDFAQKGGTNDITAAKHEPVELFPLDSHPRHHHRLCHRETPSPPAGRRTVLSAPTDPASCAPRGHLKSQAKPKGYSSVFCQKSPDYHSGSRNLLSAYLTPKTSYSTQIFFAPHPGLFQTQNIVWHDAVRFSFSLSWTRCVHRSAVPLTFLLSSVNLSEQAFTHKVQMRLCSWFRLSTSRKGKKTPNGVESRMSRASLTIRFSVVFLADRLTGPVTIRLAQCGKCYWLFSRVQVQRSQWQLQLHKPGYSGVHPPQQDTTKHVFRPSVTNFPVRTLRDIVNITWRENEIYYFVSGLDISG